MDSVISLLNNWVLFDCELRRGEKKNEAFTKEKNPGVRSNWTQGILEIID